MTTTTNNASVVAANELDRISNVLTAYGVSPKLGSEDGADGWLPGDPLYARPDWTMGGQYVRPLFQVFDEEDLHGLLRVPAESHDGSIVERWYPTCENCEVSWEGDGPCWVCGVNPDRQMTWRGGSGMLRDSAVVFVPHINNVNAPTVAEIEAAEPVPGLLPALSRASGIPVQRFYYSTTAHSPRFTRRTEPNPFDRLLAERVAAMSSNGGLPLDEWQRAHLDRWAPDRDPAWGTVSGGVTYDDSHPGVPRYTIELRHAGETVGVSFYLDAREDLARSMHRAVKAIDLQIAYRGGRRAGA